MGSPRLGFDVARSVTAVFVQQGVIYGLSLLTFGIFARFLSVDEMGLYALLLVALNLVAYGGNLGLKKIMVRLISSHRAVGEFERMKRVFWTSLLIGLIPIIVFTIGTTFFLIYLYHFMFTTPSVDPYLFLIATLIFATRFHLSGGMEGLKRFEVLSVYSAGGFTLRRIIAIFLVMTGNGLTGILTGWVIGEGLCLVLVLMEIIKDYGRPLLGYDKTLLFRQSLPMFVADLANYLVEWGDRPVVALFGLSWIALFHVAASGNTFLNTATMAIYIGVLPYLSEAFHSSGERELIMKVKDLGRYIIIFSSPISIGAAALAYPIIDLLAGPRYIGVAPLFMVIAIGVWISATSTLYQSALIAAGLTKEVMYATAVGTLLEIVLFVGLTPIFGLLSVGLGRALLLVSTFILCLYFMYKRIGLEVDWTAMWKSYLASLVMGVVVYYLWQHGIWVILSLLPWGIEYVLVYSLLLPFLIVIGITIYVAGLRILRVARVDEVALLYRSVPIRFKVVVRIISKITGLDYAEVKAEAEKIKE
ncbi:MAG: oligosaccharide flippase family protein [Nitrososphaeria archaeon]|nr:oligosaccharide flippase family protein [Nitrososphaeria archaeon]NIN52297.1 oligosaccharide flippase family protein [Nitrososphaeria archaeon]NIQ32775.1 oligosaccharide flippase family protein [Nitrososphaeria archaeon]